MAFLYIFYLNLKSKCVKILYMLIKIKVFPGSKQEKIVKKTEDSFEVRIKQKPIQGQANQSVINVLSLYFNIPNKRIKLVKGFRQRNKVFKISI